MGDSSFKNQLIRKKQLQAENKIIEKRLAVLKYECIEPSRKLAVFRKTGDGFTHDELKQYRDLQDEVQSLESVFNDTVLEINALNEIIKLNNEGFEQSEIESLKAENEALKKQLAEFENIENLDTREKTTLLKIIAVMAKENYSDLLAKPFVLGKKISQDADLLGLDLKPETTGNKIKEAKKLFD